VTGKATTLKDRSLLGYFYRAFFRAREHELSPSLRVITFAAQVVSVLSLAYVTGLWGVMLISVITLALGHRHAYRSVRDKPHPFARIGAFIALHFVFLWMFYGLFSSQRYPQAQLAMLAMAVVSWELFSRLNLYSGLGLALINLYVAATLSRDAFFALFMLAYLGLLLAFLWAADSEDGTKDDPAILHPLGAAQTTSLEDWLPSLSGLRNWGGRFGVAFLLAAVLVFVFTPHYSGRPLFKPISFRAPVPNGPSSEIVNPAVPLVQIEGWSDAESEYYYGFDSRLDLSYRGGLNDTLMMYVRSPAWSYWRSHAYDVYDGRTWTQSGKEDYRTIRGDWFYELQDPPPNAEYFVQSFYIAQPMPNLVFTGGDPVKLYVAAEEITVDQSGGVRVGAPLEPGMAYSVLSVRQDYSPEELRAAGTDYPPEITARYLQLPDTLPDRAHNLAYELAGDAPTPYDKAVILRDYLLETYPYDFYPPAQAPGSDAVDQFLFTDRRGVCEQYVSSHVIMLRSLGIPARLAAGYGSGDYNPITGYYEVRANDAHAWTEVYFPEYGWVPLDPTPGWEGDPQTGPVKRWIFSGMTDNVELPRLSLGAIDMTGIGGRGLLLSVLMRLLTFGGGLGIAVAFGWTIWRIWQRWGDDRRPRRDPVRRRIFRAYRRAQRRLGVRRLPAQTVQEQAADNPQLADLADAVDIAAYRSQPPDQSLLARVLAWRPHPRR
jgi:transglutaminase-like putative cysteine protease